MSLRQVCIVLPPAAIAGGKAKPSPTKSTPVHKSAFILFTPRRQFEPEHNRNQQVDGSGKLRIDAGQLSTAIGAFLGPNWVSSKPFDTARFLASTIAFMHGADILSPPRYRTRRGFGPPPRQSQRGLFAMFLSLERKVECETISTNDLAKSA